MNKQIKLNVVGINANPANDDRYYMTAIPTNPADAAVNPKNRYGYTAMQLGAVASSMGLPNLETLIAVVNKGGCTATIPATFHKVGDTYLDSKGVEQKYGYHADGTIKADAKDWWETDSVNTAFEWSDPAAEFIADLERATLLNLNSSDIQKNRAAAEIRRQQGLLRMAATGGRTVIRIGTDTSAPNDPANGVVDADATVIDPVDPATAVDPANAIDPATGKKVVK